MNWIQGSIQKRWYSITGSGITLSHDVENPESLGNQHKAPAELFRGRSQSAGVSQGVTPSYSSTLQDSSICSLADKQSRRKKNNSQLGQERNVPKKNEQLKGLHEQKPKLINLQHSATLWLSYLTGIDNILKKTKIQKDRDKELQRLDYK